MPALAKDLTLLVVASAAAFLIGAGTQELLVRALPVLRSVAVGPTDLGSWLGVGAVGLAFAAYAWICYPRVVSDEPRRVTLIVGVPLALSALQWMRSEDSLLCGASGSIMLCSMVVLMYCSPTLGAIVGVALKGQRPSNKSLQRAA